MVDLRKADGGEDCHNVEVGDFSDKRVVEAASTLLDCSKVKSGGLCNGTELVAANRLGGRDCGLVDDVDYLREGIPDTDWSVCEGANCSPAGRVYTFRTAASAAVASAVTAAKKAGLWPSNKPEFTNPVAAATAPAVLVFRGLITEQGGKLGSMKVQG